MYKCQWEVESVGGVDSKYTVNFPIMSLQVAGDREVGINKCSQSSVWLKRSSSYSSFPFSVPHRHIRCVLPSIPVFSFAVIA